jgi:hypothetical protein
MQMDTTTTQAPATGLRQFTVMAFPTPVLTYAWPESEAINAELRKLILDMDRPPSR